MQLRIQLSLVITILLSGSWCLTQKTDNVFWLLLSLESYLVQVTIWFGLGLLIYLALTFAAKWSEDAENRLVVFITIVSLLNLLDYGMRSVFGQVAKWPKEVLFGWAAFTLLLPAFAAFIALKAQISRSLIKKIIRISILPCIILIYYALPSEFAMLKIEKPQRTGNKPPIHMILFDSLSYDVLFDSDTINPNYPNFKSFSNEADVFLNCYSPSWGTYQVIPRVLTGINFLSIGHSGNKWLVRTEDSNKMSPISSYENIFSLAHETGYNIFLQAFAFPYLNNFENYIQSGRVYPFERLWRVGMHSLIWPILSPGGIQHQKTVDSILDNYLIRINEDSQNTLFYTHWNIPHDPFVYNANGKKLNRLELTKQLIPSTDRLSSYRNQLVGADAVLGRLIQAIKDKNTYDESLIIATSDTNIGGLDFNMHHIPLFIKRPRQSNSRTINSKVTTLKVKKYLKHFLESGKIETNLLQISQDK